MKPFEFISTIVGVDRSKVKEILFAYSRVKILRDDKELWLSTDGEVLGEELCPREPTEETRARSFIQI